MSQWDNVELSLAIERRQKLQEYNRQASEALPIDQQHVSTTTTKVITRSSGKTGVRAKKTIYQLNADAQQRCIARYWTRRPKSNSLQLEFRNVQNGRKCVMDA